MYYIAFHIHDEPLMTMGDAVASFLEKEDSTTKDMCSSTLEDFRNRRGFLVQRRQWSDKRHRWKDVTNRSGRFITVFM